MAEVLGTTDLHTIGVGSSILPFATNEKDESFEEKVYMKWS
mgnify:CR=1 FL=1